MRGLWLVGLFLASGCANTISGKVDGQRVSGARNAIFDEVTLEVPLFGSYTLAVVMLSDLPDACELMEEFIDTATMTCDEGCEDLVALKQDIPGNEHWTVTATLVAEGALDGSYSYAEVPQNGEFSTTFSSLDLSELNSEDSCNDGCASGDGTIEVNDESGSAGTIEITKHEDGLLQGSFDLTFGGDDTLKGAFKATQCNLGELFF